MREYSLRCWPDKNGGTVEKIYLPSRHELHTRSNRNGTTYLLKFPKGRLLYFGIRNDGSREDMQLSADTLRKANELGWKVRL